MIDVTKIELTSKQIFNDEQEASLLIDVRDTFAYENGKKLDKKIGSTYTVVAPKNDYEKIAIKTPELVPSITLEMIAKSNGGIFVRPVNFTARLYRSGSEYKITAKADRLEILTK